MFKLHYIDTDGECDKILSNEAEVISFANEDKKEFYEDEWKENLLNFREAVYYLDARDIEVIEI